MICVHHLGRLGNNLFQYTLSKVISEKNGFAIRGINNKHPSVLRDCDGLEFYDPVDTRPGRDYHLVDIDEAFSAEPRQIQLNGYYQRYEYYREHKQKIKNWLNFFPEFKHTPESNSITLHIRGGDLWNRQGLNENHPPCPFHYYDNILKNESFAKIYIVTEDVNDPIVKKINEKWKGTVISDTVYSDFDFMKKSSKIVISVSTLSWWAAWLSEASTVYFPEIGLFNPSIDKYHHDLTVSDESRYKNVKIPVPEFLQHGRSFTWTNSEEQRKYMIGE